jgi:hypothetical protein
MFNGTNTSWVGFKDAHFQLLRALMFVANEGRDRQSHRRFLSLRSGNAATWIVGQLVLSSDYACVHELRLRLRPPE